MRLIYYRNKIVVYSLINGRIHSASLFTSIHDALLFFKMQEKALEYLVSLRKTDHAAVVLLSKKHGNSNTEIMFEDKVLRENVDAFDRRTRGVL